MIQHPRLLVFTDLDGTLLDHHTYDWSPAIPALNALKTMGAGLILASSKTAIEIAGIRAELQTESWPSIVENGAGLLPAHTRQLDEEEDYEKLLVVINGITRELRDNFIGFADMTAEQISKITGLSASSANLAKTRSFSEPGLWKGSEIQKDTFIDLLSTCGIRVQQGGRFMTLSFGANKADQLLALREFYNPEKTLALGDASNDIDMLQAADWGVIIANPSAAPLPTIAGEREGRVVRTTEAGPTGWNKAVLEFLQNQL